MADESTSMLEAAAMSFGDHLDELRTCVIRSLIGVAVAASLTLYFGRDIVTWLCAPLWYAQRSNGLPTNIEFLNPTASLTIYLKVSLIAAFILAAPWVIYQIWLFISAGLYAAEKRIAYYLMPLSAIMCALGVMFAYYVLIPVTLLFFFNFAATFPEAGPSQTTVLDRAVTNIKQLLGREPQTALPPLEIPRSTTDAEDVDSNDDNTMHLAMMSSDPDTLSEGQMWFNTTKGELRLYVDGRVQRVQLLGLSIMNARISGDEYISFVTMSGLGIVVAFQLPVVMLIIGWLGIVTAADLARVRRYCVFGCFVLGAVLTPQDVLSMTLLSLPLWLLFEFGLILMRLTGRRRA